MCMGRGVYTGNPEQLFFLALLCRPLPSRDQNGKYTGSPAPSPLLSENPPQTRPSGGPGFNHPLQRRSSV